MLLLQLRIAQGLTARSMPSRSMPRLTAHQLLRLTRHTVFTAAQAWQLAHPFMSKMRAAPASSSQSVSERGVPARLLKGGDAFVCSMAVRMPVCLQTQKHCRLVTCDEKRR